MLLCRLLAGLGVEAGVRMRLSYKKFGSKPQRRASFR